MDEDTVYETRLAENTVTLMKQVVLVALKRVLRERISMSVR
jgi:hypothetical protein